MTTTKIIWTRNDYNLALDEVAQDLDRLEKALAEKAHGEDYCPHCHGTLHQDRNGYQVCPWCAVAMTWDEHEAGGVVAEVCVFVDEIAEPVELLDVTGWSWAQLEAHFDAFGEGTLDHDDAGRTVFTPDAPVVTYTETDMVRSLCKAYSARTMRETLRRLNIPGRSACSSKQDMATLLVANGATRW